jgi:NAD-dependent DNA ligase
VDDLEWLADLGLPVSPGIVQRCSDLDRPRSEDRSAWEGDRKDLDFDTDGIVIKLDDPGLSVAPGRHGAGGAVGGGLQVSRPRTGPRS